MRRRFKLASTVLAALIALLALPWLAWWEAGRQAYAIEAGLALRYAYEVLYRSEKMVGQALAGIDRLSQAGGEPCSVATQALMTRIVLASPYIKAIGHVRDGMLQCSSIGETGFSLGKRHLSTSDGLLIYSDVPVDGKSPGRIIAIERNGFAALVDSDLWIDVGNTVPGMSLAVLHSERRLDEPVSVPTGFIDRAWLVRLGRRSEVTFIDRQYLVAVVRNGKSPSAGVAALPLSYLPARRNAIALRLVPIGLIAGVAIAGALLLLARRQTSLATSLREGLLNDEFFLLYQPVVELKSGRCIGAEALLRWRRSTGEPIGPELFIPLAEQTGAITLLTARVLQLVEQDTRKFLATYPDFHVALNVSATDVHSDAVVRQLDALLGRRAAKASNLIVEITERGILDIEAARSVIGTLRERGIGVAIDDFGTGYAGLSYLESLQVDFLKIDRSFIEAIGTGAPTNEVVNHIIAMASAMGLKMIAEGVETEAQADYLRKRGVQFAQGWLFGKPQLLEEIAAALLSRRSEDLRQPASPA